MSSSPRRSRIVRAGNRRCRSPRRPERGRCWRCSAARAIRASCARSSRCAGSTDGSACGKKTPEDMATFAALRPDQRGARAGGREVRVRRDDPAGRRVHEVPGGAPALRGDDARRGRPGRRARRAARPLADARAAEGRDGGRRAQARLPAVGERAAVRVPGVHAQRRAQRAADGGADARALQLQPRDRVAGQQAAADPAAESQGHDRSERAVPARGRRAVPRRSEAVRRLPRRQREVDRPGGDQGLRPAPVLPHDPRVLERVQAPRDRAPQQRGRRYGRLPQGQAEHRGRQGRHLPAGGGARVSRRQRQAAQGAQGLAQEQPGQGHHGQADRQGRDARTSSAGASRRTSAAATSAIRTTRTRSSGPPTPRTSRGSPRSPSTSCCRRPPRDRRGLGDRSLDALPDAR